MSSTRWTSAQLAKNSAKPKKAKAKPAGLTGMDAIEARRNAMILVGIDPGVNTGCAVRWGFKWQAVETLPIFEAINRVIAWKKTCDAHERPIFVRLEDARQRTWFGETDRERLKGAGSVERDCKIWEEVLTELKIPFEFVHPKNIKEATEEMTGWKGRTSVHAREAAWLIL